MNYNIAVTRYNLKAKIIKIGEIKYFITLLRSKFKY